MPKLRKTLPKDFQDLINAKDDEAIKAALLKCEVGAYHGYSKDTALFYSGLSRELMDNGAMNWDRDYRMMLKKMPEYFQMGNPLAQEMQQETESIVSKILQMRYPEMIDKEPERIMEFAVEYVRGNPNPIPLEKTDYTR